MKELTGQLIGQYQIDELLGDGGMATVYRAVDSGSGRQIALKIMHAHLARKPEFQRRFQQEAITAIALDHPGIVEVYDIGEADDQLYLEMALLEGGNLGAYLEKMSAQGRQLPFEDVASIGIQLAQALDYAHRRGIVHLDIKPENVLIHSTPESGGWHVVIADFGLATLVQESGGETNPVMGSLLYMSPEQCSGGPISGQSDLYALGVILYQLATGRTPFLLTSPGEVMNKHVQVPPPYPSNFRPDLPIALETVILKALAKPPSERFQSGAEMVDAIGVAFPNSVDTPTEKPAATTVAVLPVNQPQKAEEAAETTALEAESEDTPVEDAIGAETTKVEDQETVEAAGPAQLETTVVAGSATLEDATDEAEETVEETESEQEVVADYSWVPDSSPAPPSSPPPPPPQSERPPARKDFSWVNPAARSTTGEGDPNVTQLQISQFVAELSVSARADLRKTWLHGEFRLLVVHIDESSQIHPMDKPILTVGRDASNDIVLDDPSISRFHINLERDGSAWEVVDLGSTNGAYMDGRQLEVESPMPWPKHQTLRVGPFFMMWQSFHDYVGQSNGAATARASGGASRGSNGNGSGSGALAAMGLMGAAVASKANGSNGSSSAVRRVSSDTLGVQVEPSEATVNPGERVEILISLSNQGSTVQHVQAEISGLLHEWYTTPERPIQLLPGDSGELTVALHPPPGSGTRSGDYPYQLILWSDVDADHLLSPEEMLATVPGKLVVASFNEFSVDLHPQNLEGRGTCRIDIFNEGNTNTTYSIRASDPGEAVEFNSATQQAVVAAGENKKVDFDLWPRQRPLFGSKEILPFNFTVSTNEYDQQLLAGQLEVGPRIPTWVPIAAVILAFLALGFYAILNSRVEAAETRAAEAQAQVEELTADDDGDGISNALEEQLGLDPGVADSEAAAAEAGTAEADDAAGGLSAALAAGQGDEESGAEDEEAGDSSDAEAADGGGSEDAAAGDDGGGGDEGDSADAAAGGDDGGEEAATEEESEEEDGEEQVPEFAQNTPPVANPDVFEMLEDAVYNSAPASVLDNDEDADGDTLVAVLDSNPANGTVQLNNNGTFTYTPEDDYFGEDSFSYHVNDGFEDSALTTVSFTIEPVNDPPLARADSFDAVKNNVLTGDVLENDEDVDGDVLSAILDTQPTSGAVVLNANGTFAYTPTPNYTGSDSFRYQATDGVLESGVVVVLITVRNGVPVANGDTYQVAEDTNLNSAVSVLANDVDIDGDTLSAVLVSEPAFGSVVLSPIGTFIYTPDPDFFGNDGFTYRASDGIENSNASQVTIQVNPVNDPPEAVRDTYGTFEDIPLDNPSRNVLNNDSDVDTPQSQLRAVLDSEPLSGTLTLNANGTFVYVPDLDFNGTDHFLYHANDGTADSNIVTVTVNVLPVTDLPVALPEEFSINEDQTLDNPALNVLDNDLDPDGDPLEAVLEQGPANGTLTLNSDGTFVYQPFPDFNGIDFFNYHATDGEDVSEPTTVTIEIEAVADAPEALSEEVTVAEDTPTEITLNAVDVDGDVLTFTINIPPVNGTLGPLTTVSDTVATVMYTPTLDFFGDDDFQFAVDDGGNGGQDSAVISITVTAVNDPPIVQDDVNETDEDTAINEPAPGVLANDEEPDGEPISVISGTITSTLGAQVTLYEDGSYDYDPTAAAMLQALPVGGSQLDDFEYSATDGQFPITATVVITVAGLNDAPVAVDDDNVTDEDTQLVVNAANGLLANDIDIDTGEILSVFPFNGNSGLGAALTINADGSYNYDGTASATIQALAVGETANDVINYTMQDSQGASDGAQLTIEIAGRNDAPAAVADHVATDEDTVLVDNVGVLANDVDIDSSDVLSVTSFDAATTLGASVMMDPDGSFEYDPTAVPALQSLAEGESVDDTFSYTVSDGNGGTDSTTVTVTVSGKNDPPQAVNDFASTDEDTALAVAAINGLLANDIDPDGSDVLTVSQFDAISTLGAVISVTVNDGAYEYDPTGAASLNALAVGEIITDTFQYTIIDSQGVTSTATVSVTVLGVNDIPTAVGDNEATDEDTTLNVAAPGVLSNDTDPDGSDVLSISAYDAVSGAGAAIVMNIDGSFSYDPSGVPVLNALAVGEDTFDNFAYSAADGNGGVVTGVVTITVSGVNDQPVVVDLSDSTNENDVLVVGAGSGVLAGSSDPDTSDILIVHAYSSTTTLSATVTISSDGGFEYDPSGSAIIQALSAATSITDTFVFTATDSNGGFDAGLASIIVDGANDPVKLSPGAAGTSRNFVEGGGPLPVAPDIELEDADAENRAPDTLLAWATVSITNLLDSPDEILVAVTDGANITATYDLNTGLLLLTGTDTLENYQTVLRSVTYENVSDNLNETDRSIEFLVYDGNDISDPLVITIVMDGVNDPPQLTAGPTTNTFVEDGPPVPVDAEILVEDVDSAMLISATVRLVTRPDGPSESLAINTGGTNISASYNNGQGVLTLTGEDLVSAYQQVLRSMTYDNASQNPDAGPRTITIVANDGELNSNTLTVTVQVSPDNDAPVLDLGPVSTATYTEGGPPVEVDADIQATDVDSTNLVSATVTLVNRPDSPQETLAADTSGTSISAVYDEPSGELRLTGSDSVANYQQVLRSVVYDNLSQDPDETPRTATLVVSDGALESNVAQVTINVGAVNDPPTIDLGPTATVDFVEDGGPVLVDDDLVIDDLDDNQIVSATVTIANLQDGAAELLAATPGATGIVVAYDSGSGELSLTGAASLPDYQTVLRTVTYNNSSQAPDDTDRALVFVVKDGVDNSAPANVTVTVTPVNDPPTADAGDVVAQEEVPTGISLTGGDIDGDALTFSIVSGPVSGSLGTISQLTPISAVVTYTSNVDYFGPDSFVFQVSDGVLTNTATISITVTEVNDAPVAVNDSFSVAEGGSVNGNLSTNDSDPEGHPLIYTTTPVSGPSHGSVSIDPAGTFNYLNDGSEFASDSFVYEVCDIPTGGLPVACSTATVSFTILPVNDPPVAVDDSANVAEGQSVNGNVRDNDSDPDDLLSNLSVETTPVISPVNGLVTLEADGDFTYTHDGGNTTSDSFDYRICDDNSPVPACDVGRVTIDIAAVNNAPVANDDAITVRAGDSVIGDVLANDTDQENDTLTVNTTPEDPPNDGTVELHPSGVFTYTHGNNSQNSDDFEYEVCDDGTPVECDTATVDVTINHPPEIDLNGDTTATFTEDSGPVDLDSDSDLQVEDNGNTIVSATITISNLLDGAAESLSVDTTGAPVSASYDDGSGVLLISGSANENQYRNVLRTLTYDNASDTPDTTSRIIELVAWNSLFPGDPVSITVTIIPANDAPDIDLNGTTSVAFTEDAGDVTVNSNLLLSDPDNTMLDSATVTFSSNPDGPLEELFVEVGIGINITATYNAPSGVLNLVGTETITNYQQVLRSVQYTNTSDTPATILRDIEFQVQDSDGADSNVADVMLVVSAVNDPPTADPISTTFVAVISETTDIDLTGSDPEGDVLAFIIVTLPVSGSLGTPMNTGPDEAMVVYTRTVAGLDSDSFQYKVNDGDQDSTVVTVTLTAETRQPGPQPQPDSYQVPEDSTYNGRVSVLANDEFDGAQPLEARMIDEPVHGLFHLNWDGTFLYLPDKDFFGEDSFTYVAKSGEFVSEPVTVVIEVEGSNDAPIAMDDHYALLEDTSLGESASILSNDRDADNDGLVTSLVTPPAHGEFHLNNDGTFFYQPDPDFNGVDSFTYHVSDGQETSRPGLVMLIVEPVNDPPIAFADSITVEEDNRDQTTFSLLDNDTDVDGDELRAVLTTPPAHGTAIVNRDGTVLYQPSRDFNGEDAFTYVAMDVALVSLPVTVTLFVTPVNDPPVPGLDRFTIPANATFNSEELSVLDNDRDVDGDRLQAMVSRPPTHGALLLNVDGTFVYVPKDDYVGVDTFRYQAVDEAGERASATVILRVVRVNQPPQALPDSFQLQEDGLLQGQTTNVLNNDHDADGDPLTAKLVEGVQNGDLTLSSNGSFTYAPDPDFNGEDSFTYVAQDGKDESDVVQVTLQVTAVNDAPIAVEDSFELPANTPFDSSPDSVLSNDTDIDSLRLTTLLRTPPANGQFFLNTDGTFIYLPEEDFEGTDLFVYAASDGAAESTAVTVTLQVGEASSAAITALPDIYTLLEDGRLGETDGNVLANDSASDGSRLTAILVDEPEHGSFFLNADGTFVYMPEDNFNGTDYFTYYAGAGSLRSETVTVALRVQPVNDAPLARPDNFDLGSGLTASDASLSVLANDVDIEGDTLTAVLESAPLQGNFFLNADGTFIYQPPDNFQGTVQFTYYASDGMARSEVVVVTLTVGEDSINE